MPYQDGSGAVTVRRPDGGVQLIPPDVIQSRNPDTIRAFLKDAGVPEARFDVRPLTEEGLKNFGAMLEQRGAEVQAGMADPTDEQGRSAFQSTFPETKVPFTDISLVDIARLVTPKWLEGKGLHEYGTKVTEQLLRPIGLLARNAGSALKASGELTYLPNASGFLGDKLRSLGEFITAGMEVPGPADASAVADSWRMGGLEGKAAAAADVGSLAARGYLENAPQLAAAILAGPTSAEATLAQRLAPIAATALPSEVGDIYERAIEEGREGPNSAAAAIAGGAVNAALEAIPELRMLRSVSPVSHELRKAASRSLANNLFGQPAITAATEMIQEPIQEMVGYGAERLGGADPSTWSELGNRAATASIMAAGSGGAMAVPTGIGNVSQAAAFRRAQQNLQDITAQISKTQDVRGRLAKMSEDGVEEIADPDGKTHTVDYLLGRADTQLESLLKLQKDLAKLTGDELPTEPMVPVPSRTADEAAAEVAPKPARASRSDAMVTEALLGYGMDRSAIDVLTPAERAEALAKLNLEDDQTESSVATKQPETVIDVDAASTELANRIKSQGLLADSKYTDEGIRQALGATSGRLSDLVAAGLITRGRDGFYEFGEDVQRKATPRNITPDAPSASEESTQSPPSHGQFLADIQDIGGVTRRFLVHANSNRIKLFEVRDDGTRTGRYHEISMPSEFRDQSLDIEKLKSLINSGVRVAIETSDDRGTYTTLRRIKKEPSDQGKNILRSATEKLAETEDTSKLLSVRKPAIRELALPSIAPTGDLLEKLRAARRTDELAAKPTEPTTPTTPTPAEEPAVEMPQVDARAEALKWQKASPASRMRMIRKGSGTTAETLTYAEADKYYNDVLSEPTAKEKPTRKRKIVERAIPEMPIEQQEQIAKVGEAKTGVVTQEAKDAIEARKEISKRLAKKKKENRANLEKDLADLVMNITPKANIVPGGRKTSEILTSIATGLFNEGYITFRELAIKVRDVLASRIGSTRAAEVAPIETLRGIYLAITRPYRTIRGVSTKEQVLTEKSLPDPIPASVESAQPAQPKPSAPAEIKLTKKARVAKPEEARPNRRPSDEAMQKWMDLVNGPEADIATKAVNQLAALKVSMGMDVPASSWTLPIPPGYAQVGDNLVVASDDPSITVEKTRDELKREKSLEARSINWSTDMGWSGLSDHRDAVAASAGDRVTGVTITKAMAKRAEKAIEPNGPDDRAIKAAEKTVAVASAAVSNADRTASTEAGDEIVLDLSAEGFANDKVLVKGDKPKSVDRQTFELEQALADMKANPDSSVWLAQALPIVSRPALRATVEQVNKSDGGTVLEFTVRVKDAGDFETPSGGIELVRQEGDDAILRVKVTRALNPEYIEAVMQYDQALLAAIGARRTKTLHERIVKRSGDASQQNEAIVEIPPIPDQDLNTAQDARQAIKVLERHAQKLENLRSDLTSGQYESKAGRIISLPLSIEAVNMAIEDLDSRIADLAMADFLENNADWVRQEGIQRSDLRNLMAAAVSGQRADTSVRNLKIGSMPHPTDAEMERLNAIPEPPNGKYPPSLSREDRIRWRYSKLRLKFRPKAREALRLQNEIRDLEARGESAEKIAAVRSQLQPPLDIINDVELEEKLKAAIASKDPALIEAAREAWKGSNEETSRLADGIARSQRWDYGVPGLGEAAGSPPQNRGLVMRNIMMGLPIGTRIKALWYGAQLAKSQMTVAEMDEGDYTKGEIEQQASRLTRSGKRKEAMRMELKRLWNRTVNSAKPRGEANVGDDLNALAAAAIALGHHYRYDEGSNLRDGLKMSGVLSTLVTGTQHKLVNRASAEAATAILENAGLHFLDAAGRQEGEPSIDGDPTKPWNKPYHPFKDPISMSDDARLQKDLVEVVAPNWQPASSNRNTAATTRKWAVVLINPNAKGNQGGVLLLPIKVDTVAGKNQTEAKLRIQTPINLGGQAQAGNMVPIETLKTSKTLSESKVLGVITLALEDATDSFPLSGSTMRLSFAKPLLDYWASIGSDAAVMGSPMPLDAAFLKGETEMAPEEEIIEREFSGFIDPEVYEDAKTDVTRDAVLATQQMLVYMAGELHRVGLTEGATNEDVLEALQRVDSRFIAAVGNLYDAITTPGSARNGGTILGSGTEGISTREDFYARFVDAIRTAANEYVQDQQDAEGQTTEAQTERRGRRFSIDPVVGLGQSIANAIGVSVRSGAWPRTRETGEPDLAAGKLGRSELDVLQKSPTGKALPAELALRNAQQMRAARFAREAPNVKWVDGAQGTRTAILDKPSEIAALRRVFGDSNETRSTIPSWWRITATRRGGYTIRDFGGAGYDLRSPQTSLPFIRPRSQEVAQDPFQRSGEPTEDPEATARYGRQYTEAVNLTRSRVTEAELPPPQRWSATAIDLAETGPAPAPADVPIRPGYTMPSRANPGGRFPAGWQKQHQEDLKRQEAEVKEAEVRERANLIELISKKKERRLESPAVAPSGQPMDRDELVSTIESILGGKMPDSIQVVDSLVGSQGEEIPGDYDPPTGITRINRSLMSTRANVLHTLVHEGVHMVANDTAVQEALADVLNSLPEDTRRIIESLYSDETTDVQREEKMAAGVEAIIEQAPTHLLAKAWQAIKDALLRIPGMARFARRLGFNTSGYSARRVMAHALGQMAIGGRIRGGPRMESRFLFGGKEDLTSRQAEASTEGRVELQAQASVQAGAVPKWTADQVNQWSQPAPFSFASNPSAAITEAAKRRAARSLRWLAELREMDTQRKSPNDLWDAAKAMPRNTEAQKDAADRAAKVAILASLGVLDLRNRVLRELDKAQADFTAATQELSNSVEQEDALSQTEPTRILARISSMRQDLEEWVETVYRLSEDGTELAESQMARDAIASLLSGDAAAKDFELFINKLLSDPEAERISEDSKLTDGQKLQELLSGPIPLVLLGDPQLSKSDFLQRIQQPLANGATPLSAFISLPSILRETHLLRNEKRRAQLKQDEILKRYRTTARYGVLDMGKFADKLIREAEKLGEAKHVRAMAYESIRRAMVKQQESAMRVDLLTRLSTDPQYANHVRQAATVGQLRSPGILRSNVSGHYSQRDPKIDGGTDDAPQNLPPNTTALVMPDNGETILFRHSFTRTEDEAMQKSIRAALDRINAWLKEVEAGNIKDVDPVKADEYHTWVSNELLSMLDRRWWVKDNQTYGTFLSLAYHTTKMKSEKAAMLGSMLDAIGDLIGTQYGRQLRRAMSGVSRVTADSYDLMNEIRIEAPPAIEKSLKKHGIEVRPGSDYHLWKYYREILNPIVASGQTNERAPLQAGSEIWVPSTGEVHKVRPEDMEVARILKRWNDHVRDTFEQAKSAIEEPLRVAVPANQTDRGQQGPEERRSASPGKYTAARTASPELRQLLRDWVQSAPRLQTQGREAGPLDEAAAADIHWDKYFRTDSSTGLPVDRQVWGDILVGHIAEGDPEYIGHDHAGIGDLYDGLRSQLENGWRPKNSDEILERLGRGLKLREIEKAQEKLKQALKAAKNQQTPAVLEAEQNLKILMDRSDREWRELAKSRLMADIEHTMGVAAKRYSPASNSAVMVVAREARDEFTAPRGALLAPSRMMNHLPIDQAGQHIKLASGVDHMMRRLETSLRSAYEGLSTLIEQAETKRKRTGVETYTSAEKKEGKILHTLQELMDLRSAIGFQLEFAKAATDESFAFDHNVQQWMGLVVRGASSIVLGPITNPAAVTRDVLVTSGVWIPLMTLGLGSGFRGIMLSSPAGIARAIRGGIRRLAGTKVGRKIGAAIPMIAEMAAAHERNKALMQIRGLADNRVALEALWDATGGITSTGMANRPSRLGQIDEKGQQAVSALTQWMFQTRGGAEAATNIISALEGWSSQLRKLKRRYRQAMQDRAKNGTDVSDPAAPGFGITADEAFSHNIANSVFFDRRDSLRNWQDLFAETRGLDRELREWYEKTRQMPESQALAVSLAEPAERATARRWIARTTRPQLEQVSLARRSRGALGTLSKVMGMHKSQVSAVRTTIATMLGRSVRQNGLTRNLALLGGLSLGLVAVALGLAAGYEIPRLLKKGVAGGLGSFDVDAGDVANDPELLGKYLSQITLVNSGLFPNIMSFIMGANMSYDPLSLGDQYFGFGILEDILKAGSKAIGQGPMDAAAWLARRRVPVLNWLLYNVDGSKEAETLYRAYRKYAPEELAKEPFMPGGSLKAASSSTGTARQAANAKIAGLESDYQGYKARLMRELREAGTPVDRLEREAETDIAQQMPMRRALRREPTDAEMSILRRRMDSDERLAMAREMNYRRSR